MVVKFVQPKNKVCAVYVPLLPTSMVSKFLGRVIVDSVVQWQNTLVPKETIVSGKTISSIALLCWKAKAPIEIKPSLKSKFNVLQLAKAQSPMVVTFSCPLTRGSLEQL